MNYVLLHADLTALDDTGADAFADAAADLGLDVIDLAPDLADAEMMVLISTSLAALVSKVAEIAGADAAERLWGLIQSLWRRDTEHRAIEDRERRITFVFDEAVRRSGPVALTAMMNLASAIDAIPDGTTLKWNAETRHWSADQPRLTVAETLE